MAPAAPVAGPLHGLRVLEVGSFIAGPFAGQLLGDYGAEVIKVESPGDGDAMRTWGITVDGESLWWSGIARNKQSVAIDLRDPRGQDLVRRLAAQCDVVVENFRPGRIDEWGLGYEQLREINPGVIVVHVSGYGQTGPRAGEAGFGSVGEAMGGIRFTTGEPDRPPARCGVSLGDSLAALFAVIGTLAAINERHVSGLGQEVDVAIYEAVFALMESTIVDHEVGGVTRSRTGSVLPGVAPSNAYRCADGGEVIIAANADTVFARLCSAMGAADLAQDGRFATHAQRGAHQRELDELISAWTESLKTDDALAVLEEAGVPAGRIFSAPDILEDLQYQARDMILRRTARTGREVPMAGVVPKFSRTPGSVRDVGPALGEHTQVQLQRHAGVDPDTWQELVADGIVGAAASPGTGAVENAAGGA